MLKLRSAFALCATLTVVISCSDDDGADVPRNSMSGVAGTGGRGGASGSAGTGGRGGASGGASGSSGAAGGGMGGMAGAAGCSNVSLDGGVLVPDAGDADAGMSDAGEPDASADGGIPLTVSFAADIHPIFEASCGPCHITQSSGNHNIGGEVMQAYLDAVGLEERLLERIVGGSMPPDCTGAPGSPGCLTVAEVALITAWTAQCYPR